MNKMPKKCIKCSGPAIPLVPASDERKGEYYCSKCHLSTPMYNGELNSVEYDKIKQESK